uniref:Uncharacterized protein n=1 Tax=Mola mola TaxID=94237 RepID=A0A3Q3X9Q5_MOLML
ILLKFLVLFLGGAGIGLTPVLVVVGGLLPLQVLSVLTFEVVVTRKLHALHGLQTLLTGLGMSLYVFTAGEQLATDVTAE